MNDEYAKTRTFAEMFTNAPVCGCKLNQALCPSRRTLQVLSKRVQKLPFYNSYIPILGTTVSYSRGAASIDVQCGA